MISDPKNLSEQLCNLSERLGIEMRTLNRTKVSTVNGLIPDNSGAITVDVGVTSFNGSKGAVTYTAPVTSVNGQTGAVSVDVGVKTVNGTQPDSDGNVTIQTGGDTSNLVPKTGNRGTLGGYNDCAYYNGHNGAFTVIINKDSPDDICIDAWDEKGNNPVECEITFASEENGGAFVKNIFLSGLPSAITVNFEGTAMPENYFSNYEMELELGLITQIVFANYAFTGIVSSKVLIADV